MPVVLASMEIPLKIYPFTTGKAHIALISGNISIAIYIYQSH